MNSEYFITTTDTQISNDASKHNGMFSPQDATTKYFRTYLKPGSYYFGKMTTTEDLLRAK